MESTENTIYRTDTPKEPISAFDPSYPEAENLRPQPSVYQNIDLAPEFEVAAPGLPQPRSPASPLVAAPAVCTDEQDITSEFGYDDSAEFSQPLVPLCDFDVFRYYPLAVNTVAEQGRLVEATANCDQSYPELHMPPSAPSITQPMPLSSDALLFPSTAPLPDVGNADLLNLAEDAVTGQGRLVETGANCDQSYSELHAPASAPSLTQSTPLSNDALSFPFTTPLLDVGNADLLDPSMALLLPDPTKGVTPSTLLALGLPLPEEECSAAAEDFYRAMGHPQPSPPYELGSTSDQHSEEITSSSSAAPPRPDSIYGSSDSDAKLSGADSAVPLTFQSTGAQNKRKFVDSSLTGEEAEAYASSGLPGFSTSVRPLHIALGDFPEFVDQPSDYGAPDIATEAAAIGRHVTSATAETYLPAPGTAQEPTESQAPAGAPASDGSDAADVLDANCRSAAGYLAGLATKGNLAHMRSRPSARVNHEFVTRTPGSSPPNPANSAQYPPASHHIPAARAREGYQQETSSTAAFSYQEAGMHGNAHSSWAQPPTSTGPSAGHGAGAMTAGHVPEARPTKRPRMSSHSGSGAYLPQHAPEPYIPQVTTDAAAAYAAQLALSRLSAQYGAGHASYADPNVGHAYPNQYATYGVAYPQHGDGRAQYGGVIGRHPPLGGGLASYGGQNHDQSLQQHQYVGSHAPHDASYATQGGPYPNISQGGLYPPHYGQYQEQLLAHEQGSARNEQYLPPADNHVEQTSSGGRPSASESISQSAGPSSQPAPSGNEDSPPGSGYYRDLYPPMFLPSPAEPPAHPRAPTPRAPTASASGARGRTVPSAPPPSVPAPAAAARSRIAPPASSLAAAAASQRPAARKPGKNTLARPKPAANTTAPAAQSAPAPPAAAPQPAPAAQLAAQPAPKKRRRPAKAAAGPITTLAAYKEAEEAAVDEFVNISADLARREVYLSGRSKYRR